MNPPSPELAEAARTLAKRARRTASICTGTFILAAAGLLDGRRATTHWHETTALARAHPAIEVVPDAIYVEDGQMFSSAGITAGIDLALALVELDHGAALARDVARWLVVFLQRPGGQSQNRDPLEDGKSAGLVTRRDGERWLLADYRRMLASGAVTFGALFSRLAAPGRLPAVIHCLAGKDRTGLTVALLLTALGVPRQVVLDDYQLTNDYRGVAHSPEVVALFV